ncbi:MAG TPA: LCP family protein [Pseudonocardia sp.]
MTEPLDPKPPRTSGRRRSLLIGAAVLAVLLLATGSAGFYLSEHFGNNVDRVPNVFAPLDPATRPPATGALTFLLVGTDTRSESPTTGSLANADIRAASIGGDHSDVLMIARVDPSRTHATVVSIPRDSWVDIPGHNLDKINNAYAMGGPTLLIQTVEGLTDIRIDHLAVIDFAGFQSMVDAVGGIDMTISPSTGGSSGQGVTHLDGAAALRFLRQHDQVTDDDHAQREQAALRALLGKATSNGLFSDLKRLYRLMDATTQSVDVDDTLTNGGLASLALELRDLHASDIQFLRAPIGSVQGKGQQTIAYLDPRAADLWAALRNGSSEVYVNQHHTDVLGTVTH